MELATSITSSSFEIRIDGSRNIKAIEKAQSILDNMVLQDCNALLPFNTGALQGSGINGTVIGSGEVTWAMPYAHYVYQGDAMVGVESKSAWAKRGEPKEYNGKKLEFKQGEAEWFETAKQQHGNDWIQKVKEVVQHG